MSELIDDVGVPFAYQRLHPRVMEGPGGRSYYTTKPDEKGKYYSYYCKPAGPGARAGNPEYFRYVPRKTGSRATKIAAKRRSENLALGKPITEGVKPKKKTKNSPGSAYCPSCKTTIKMESMQARVTQAGRQRIEGSCPTCHCTVQKFGTLIQCPECETLAEGSSDDYLCKACRNET